MALPSIVTRHLSALGAMAPMGAPPGPPPGGTPPPAGGSGALTFTMHPQVQSNWCWSAVGVSVAQFFSSGTSWTSQCHLAGTELGATCCPDGTNPGTCNVPWYLDRTLTRTGNYNTYGSGAATAAQIQTEINGGRPLGVRIGWLGGGGHFLVVTGFSNSGAVDYVTVQDPIFATSTLTYAAFCSSYQSTGSWTHSYWTKP